MKLQNISNIGISNERFVKTKYPIQYAFITTFFTWCNSYKERVYCLNNNIFVQPKCPVCGNYCKFTDRKYTETCSKKCRNILQANHRKQTCLERYGVTSYAKTNECRKKMKQTCLERYGDENYNNRNKMHQTCLERYGGVGNASKVLNEKYKQTCLERYGVTSYTKTVEYKQKIKQTKLERYNDENYNNRTKSKQTMLDRYGYISPFSRSDVKEKSKQTMLDRYGVESYAKSKSYKYNIDKIQQKIVDTKRKNKSFNTSKIEEQFAAWLKDNNINFVRQYKSEQYPFCCDFYFPDKDLYFEINGHCVHNNHPFDANNKSDIETLNKWKQKNSLFYKNMINVWTVTDPLKVYTANEKKLNFKVVYSCSLDKIIQVYKNSEIDI